MRLAEFVESNRGRLIERWKELAQERLGLELEYSELVNHLPAFIDDLIQALRTAPDHAVVIESAREHGRHRMRAGVDIGGLTEEMVLVAEVICEFADADRYTIECDELRRLNRAIGLGTATSVRAYAAMRDREIMKQAARHFSFVAHEIRTPLHAAILASRMLVEGRSQDRVKHAERLDRALGQLAALVDESLLHARVSGEFEIRPGRVDVQQIVETACENVALHADSRGLYLERDVEPCEIEVDSKLVTSALTNLLKNAVKFTRESTHIRIRVRVQEDRVLCEIEDECGGMPADVPARLFQPFVQLGTDKSGFGLGLVIVKHVVDAHDGSVRIANRPGDGCTFVMELPARPTERDPTQRDEPDRTP